MLVHCGNTALCTTAHVRISPIYACIPHREPPWREKRSWNSVFFYSSAQNRPDPLMDDLSRNRGGRRTICVHWSSQVKGEAFRPPCSGSDKNPGLPKKRETPSVKGNES